MTPAQRIESQLLTEAFALRGMNLLNRKELYGEHSNTVYDYCHDQFMSDIELYNGIYHITTDGWKRKAARRGGKLRGSGNSAALKLNSFLLKGLLQAFPW